MIILFECSNNYKDREWKSFSQNNDKIGDKVCSKYENVVSYNYKLNYSIIIIFIIFVVVVIIIIVLLYSIKRIIYTLMMVCSSRISLKPIPTRNFQLCISRVQVESISMWT